MMLFTLRYPREHVSTLPLYVHVNGEMRENASYVIEGVTWTAFVITKLILLTQYKTTLAKLIFPYLKKIGSMYLRHEKVFCESKESAKSYDSKPILKRWGYGLECSYGNRSLGDWY